MPRSALAVTALLLVSAWTVLPHAEALSCMQAAPKVGVFTGRTDTEGWGVTVHLKGVATFEEQRVFGSGTTRLNGYDAVFKAYRAGELPRLDEERDWQPDRVTVPTAAWELMGVRAGDVIVHGPPRHVCGYGFVLAYTPTGDRRAGSVNADYVDHDLGGALLGVTPGPAESCRDHTCNVMLELAFNGRVTRAGSGSTTHFDHEALARVHVLEASDYHGRDDGRRVHDWGMGRYAQLVMVFSDEATTESCSTWVAPQPSPSAAWWDTLAAFAAFVAAALLR